MKKALPVIISLLFLSIPLIYILISLVNGHLLNEFMLGSSIIICLLTLMFAIIRKISWKIRSCVLLIIFPFVFLGFLWLNGVGGYDKFDVYENEQSIRENSIYFEKEEYGNYKDIAYYHFLSTGIFQQESFTFIMKYDEENFKKQADKINCTYSFYDEPVMEEEPVPVFTLDNFKFRLRDTSTYPKVMDFVGINDESKEIAYLSFYDYELDGVWAFDDLLYVFGGWHYIDRARNAELTVFG